MLSCVRLHIIAVVHFELCTLVNHRVSQSANFASLSTCYKLLCMFFSCDIQDVR